MLEFALPSNQQPSELVVPGVGPFDHPPSRRVSFASVHRRLFLHAPLLEVKDEIALKHARDDIGIIPLGLPSLAGPGTITTVIALDSQAENMGQTIGIYVAIALVCGIAWMVLAAAPIVTRKLGQTGMNVFTRIMGLLVMVVGSQFVINGVTTVLRSVNR